MAMAVFPTGWVKGSAAGQELYASILLRAVLIGTLSLQPR
jgi:hypothetical protein